MATSSSTRPSPSEVTTAGCTPSRRTSRWWRPTTGSDPEGLAPAGMLDGHHVVDGHHAVGPRGLWRREHAQHCHREGQRRTMVDLRLGELLPLVIISPAVAVGDIVPPWRLK